MSTARFGFEEGGEVRRIAKSHGARRFRVLSRRPVPEPGSSAGVRVVVEMDPGCDLWDLVDFRRDLEAHLRCPVEVNVKGRVHTGVLSV